MVKLRVIVESDLDRIVELCQDPTISEMTLNIPYPYTYEHARYFYDHIVLNTTSKQYAIYLEDNTELIGLIGINFNQTKDWMAEIGYWMGKDYRNHGYMTEALKLIIQICFEEFKLIRVCATHNPTNAASGKVMLKAGMIYEGTLRANVRKGTDYIDSPYYSIINPIV
jgi:RimJ/RimL family protein N-acetyltransferase